MIKRWNIIHRREDFGIILRTLVNDEETGGLIIDANEVSDHMVHDQIGYSAGEYTYHGVDIAVDCTIFNQQIEICMHILADTLINELHIYQILNSMIKRRGGFGPLSILPIFLFFSFFLHFGRCGYFNILCSNPLRWGFRKEVA